MNILVTGGAGYIGAHVCVELLHAGHNVVVLDNFSNSKPAVLERISRIAGRAPVLIRADIRERACVQQTLEQHRIDTVMHLAGLKAVGESVASPLAYYDCNVGGTLSLLQAMRDAAVTSIIFSSSATVYGNPASLPIREDFPCAPTNPYGQSKRMIEHMLLDAAAADKNFSPVILRYFNPVGAHPSGLIGEDPQDTPNNLLPFVSQVALGRRQHVSVFGNDWATPDGTGVRDYLHVMDLAKGHLAALAPTKTGAHIYNLGTGRSHSVLEVIQAMARASGRTIPHVITARRPGDIAAAWADPTLAWRELGWRANLSLDTACNDAWQWQTGNPDGYPDTDAP